MLAYLFLAASDFLYFLYSRRLSRGIGAIACLLLAVGWHWWYFRLAEENEVTKLNLDGPTESNHGKP